MRDSFFDEVKRISAPDYIPNEADVLRARTKTTGIYETRFTIKASLFARAAACAISAPPC